MEDDGQEGKPSASILARYRSPTFSKVEVQTLVNIIDRYKYTLLNKATNASINQAKELAWGKVAKIFNNQGFQHERSIESLKMKWDNLKRDLRRVSKNDFGEKDSINEMRKQIVNMAYEVENNVNNQDVEDIEDDFSEVVNEANGNLNLKRKPNWDSCDEKDSENNGGDDEKRINRSLNFSPEECSLLLECVKREKKYVFCKEYNSHSLALKNRAWKRVTFAFNKKSPQNRTTKVLRTKFNNMKTIANTMDIKEPAKKYNSSSIIKHEKLVSESTKNIKTEPVFQVELEVENGNDDDDGGHNSDSNHESPDPLSNILNSDSGIGSTHSNVWSPENKEVVMLKIELLKYQMETAKLERQRIEKAAQAEAASCEASRIEASLRLRAARLEAAAAALKLPRGDPALLYTPEEQPAEKYLSQYEDT